MFWWLEQDINLHFLNQGFNSSQRILSQTLEQRWFQGYPGSGWGQNRGCSGYFERSPKIWYGRHRRGCWRFIRSYVRTHCMFSRIQNFLFFIVSLRKNFVISIKISVTYVLWHFIIYWKSILAFDRFFFGCWVLWYISS